MAELLGFIASSLASGARQIKTPPTSGGCVAGDFRSELSFCTSSACALSAPRRLLARLLDSDCAEPLLMREGVYHKPRAPKHQDDKGALPRALFPSNPRNIRVSKKQIASAL